MVRGKRVTLLLSLLLALLLASAAACTPASEPAPEPAQETVEPQVALGPTDAMIEAAADYLEGDPGSSISGRDLYDSIQAGDPTYMTVDVRAPEHYAKGHVAGAISIPFETVYEQENLDKLDPRKIVVVADYNGHDASEVSMFYNMLGYDAMALRFGMAGWTLDADVVGLDPTPSGEAAGYPTGTESADATGTYDLPALEVENGDVNAVIVGQMQAYLESGRPGTMSAADADQMIVRPENPDYQIIDVRPAEDYAKGHIKGARNILWTEIADAEKLAMLDPGKKVLVYCQTGHTAADATLFLNLLGYEAVGIEYGMCGWSHDPEPPHGSCYDPGTVPGFPIVSAQDS